jgi:hypothetical protein
MPGLLTSLRDWWRWRLRRSQVHVHGVAEFRRVGIVKGEEGAAWRLEDSDGRLVRVSKQTPVLGIRVGDRVEIEPTFQSTAGSRLNLAPDWTIGRKL